ncbi:hypothetical protein ACFPRA_08040 [Sporosarcina soli]|uniref:Uncharacterized protein n=1 Tax=Sporosarcina soli TaxID=334736 RepID=A0ABW0TJ69_9BACL
MRILIDQTLGIPVSKDMKVIIREPSLKKKQKLEEIIEKRENRLLKTRLPVLKRTTEVELAEIGMLLKKHRRILYIYDSKMTDEGALQRVRNWYLPEYTLQIVDGSRHRAYALYLLKMMGEGYSPSRALPPANGHLISNVKRITVSNYQKIGRNPKKKCYLLSGEQLENKKSETNLALLDQLLKSHPETKFIAVGNTEVPEMENLEYYPLEKWAFPNSVNYLSIFPLPERSDRN